MKQLLLFSLIIFVFNIGVSQDQEILPIHSDIEIIQLSENAYMHVSYIHTKKWGRISANGIILIKNGKAFLFDSPWNNDLTEVLINWISDSLNAKLIGFIPNHWHEDCMGGLEVIHKNNIPSYAHQITVDSAFAKGLPTPQKAFTDSIIIPFEQRTIRCYYLGAAHTTDNIVVWLPNDEILFAACTIRNINAKHLGNTADGSLVDYYTTVKKIWELFQNAQIVVPGHGKHGGFELVEHTLSLAETAFGE
jgi:metallo-beta-lactamase class B